MQWAKNKYRYYHLFCSDATQFSDNPNDHLAWAVDAGKIVKDLKEYVCIKADEEVLRIAKLYHLSTSEITNPTNVTDVIKIVADNAWYHGNLDLNREIIYRMAYGIFRIGGTQWATKFAEDWLLRRKLTYGAGAKGKGFVYTILASRASDSLSKMFRNSMEHAHKEFIAVRKPKGNSIYHYIELFLGSNSY